MFHRSGGIDDAHGDQTVLESALDGGGADWEITRYSGVDHGFTNWESPDYSLKADYRSWQSMLTSMKELMPLNIDGSSMEGDGMEAGEGEEKSWGVRDGNVLMGTFFVLYVTFFV